VSKLRHPLRRRPSGYC